jgi:NADPH-dependent glutamate synthase beta subunit-like oxidoreductase
MTQIMEEGGCQMRYIDPQQLLAENDALLLATGATRSFDPTENCPGRNLRGIFLAMDFLTRNTKSLLDSGLRDGHYISARDRDVIVIGGGDTGADCIGTALRHGCKSLVNFELLDRPPAQRAPGNPWPEWPRVYRVDYSHAEAQAVFGEDPRAFSVLTTAFADNGRGHVRGVVTTQVDWSKPGDGSPFSILPGSEREWPADMVLLATGFLGPEQPIAQMLGLAMQRPRGNWETFQAAHGPFVTNVPRVFAAGDCRRGQSLVVWAINEGRGAARAIDQFLMGTTSLPAPGLSLGSAMSPS